MTTPDGAHTDTSYSGNQATVTDPAGKDRETVTDALGRLTDVYENPTGLNYHTQYQYDPLDDLTTVSQGDQTRSFTYDWLKRLQSAQNPESGTVNYTQYDNNGNLLSKTEARGVTTTLTYDGLNRIRSKAYSGGAAAATPAVTYCYDGKLAGATDGACNNPSIANAIGRLTQVSSTASKTAYSAFDTMGRVTSSSQTTGGQTYTFPLYTYNLAGALTSVTYPSGRVVNTGYDGAGRANQLGTATDATAYVSSVQYASHGAARQIALHNGVTETTTFDPQRLQPAAISAGSLALNYYYCPSGGTSCTSNNGNLLRQTIGTGTINVTQDYGYDGVNRLKTAQETGAAGWAQTYVYDAFGNRALVAGTSYYVPGGAWTPQVTADDSTQVAAMFSGNRWNSSNIQYDGGSPSVGNVTGLSVYTFTYDGENRQTSAEHGGITMTYTYDGEGRRVMKTQGTTTTYVYDAAGQLAAEYSAQPNQSPCGTCYLTADHLGSTRMMTDGNGTQVALHDYLPFGEEIPAAMNGRSSLYGGDLPTQKFTGKERDVETGLDFFGARYFSGAQGRFISPDPKQISRQRMLDPQQWNMYSYTRNNPLVYVDPDGMELTPVEVHVTGGVQAIRYMDTRVVTRLQNVVSNARSMGMTFTFNELFRTQTAQADINTSNTKNTTGTSPHAAGLAFDVNVSTSLKPDGSKSLPDLTAAAGKENANFTPLADQSKDPPHFQANDLITRDKSGSVDQAYKDLIEENQKSYTELENLRKENPEEFNKKVVVIDSYTPEKKQN